MKRDSDTGVHGAPRRRWTRGAFYLHLWLGVIATLALVSISITGVLLNHKRGLGLMPDVPHEPRGALPASVSIDSLARSALHAVPEARGSWTPGAPVDPAPAQLSAGPSPRGR